MPGLGLVKEDPIFWLRIEMIQKLLLLFTLVCLGCGLTQVRELPEINLDKNDRIINTSGEVGGTSETLLIGPVWKWQQTIYSTDTRSLPPNPENYTLKLLPDGKINIRADCNLGGGVYKLRGNEISIQITHTTRAACPPESLEQNYIQDLNTAGRYRIEGGFLYIGLKNDNGTMRFTL
jgi:heat shock protein HslJ